MDAASEISSISHESVYAYLRRLTGNEANAADLTQVTYSRVWAALGDFLGESRVLTWIYGIARYVYLDWRRGHRPESHPPDYWWENCTEAGPGPFESAADREVAQRLFALVDQLDEEKRETVHLH